MLVYPIPIGFIQYIGVNDLLLKKTHKKNGNSSQFSSVVRQAVSGGWVSLASCRE